MFKVFKYLFVANLYKRAKKSIILFFASFIALILVTLIMNDVIAVASGMSVYMLLLSKWIMILLLLAFIGFYGIKIVNIAFAPFSSNSDNDDTSKILIISSTDSKKAKILNKEQLHTKSDLIIQKYMKDS